MIVMASPQVSAKLSLRMQLVDVNIIVQALNHFILRETWGIKQGG